MPENQSSMVCEQQRCRPACTDAYLSSLISAFVIRLLERIISRPSMSKIFSVAEQAGLNLTLSETLKTGFLTSLCLLDWLHVLKQSHQS